MLDEENYYAWLWGISLNESMVAREEGKGGMEEGPRQGDGQGPKGGCLREIPKSQVNLNENRSNFALQAH